MTNSAFTVTGNASGTGTVSNIATGYGLTGGPITTTGTISLLPSILSNRNMLFNGDFLIWQRYNGGSGTFSLTNTTVYGPDRWQCQTGAATSTTFSQQPDTTSGSYFLRVQRNNGNAGISNNIVEQSLTRDMSFGAAGNAITVSFKARAGAQFSAAGGNLNVHVISGTGNNDVSNLTTGFVGANTEINQNATLTNNFQTFSFTSGTLGATVTQLAVLVQYAGVGVAGALDYFDIKDVKLELGTQATSYVYLSMTEQLILCKAFYQKSFFYNFAPSQNSGDKIGEFIEPSTGQFGLNSNLFGAGPFIFPTEMIQIPAITLYNPNANNAQARNLTRANDFNGTLPYNISQKSFNWLANVSAGTLIGDAIAVHWTAEADLT